MEAVRIDLLGCAITIQTDETKEYVQRLVAVLERRLGAVKDQTGLTDPMKVSLVAGLFLVDELLRNDGGMRSEDAEIERRTMRLIEKLDNSLTIGIPASAGFAEQPEELT
jgi:cell division protein ZapA (FtsZ GTPase activity inhibitor)